MSKVIAALSIDLTANVASFSAAMDKATQISLSSTKNIAKSFALVGTAAAAMGVAVAGAVAGMVVKADEYVTSIQRMSEKTGQSTEELSKLAYASALTGGSLDDLGGLLIKFNRSAASSAEGNKKAEAAFKGLGVSVVDSTGHFRPATALLEESIAKLSAMPASIKKTALEMDIFGKSGAQLAPVLKILGTNAAQTAADMKNFGLALSGPQAEAAEHLSQTYERGKVALIGMSETILTSATPALQALADKVISLASNGQLVSFAKAIGEDVSKAATLASTAFGFLATHAKAVKEVLVGFATAEAISFLLGINTAALSASSGLAKLVLGFGMFAGKATGLGPLVATIGSLGGAIVATTLELFGMVGAFGIAETATYAMETAWASFNAALVAYPAAFALAGLAAGFYVLYHAIETDVAQAEKLGGVAVTWSDQWAAAVANTTDRLAGLKKILQDMLPGSEGSIAQDVKAFNAIPTFGQRAEQIAQQRQKDKSNAKVKAPEPVIAEPLPSPSTKPAKPDPYQGELAKLNTKLKNSQLTLNAAMQDSVDAQRAATEAGKAGLIVTALQTKLKRDLTSTERAAITNAVRDTGENEHNASVIDSLRQRTDASKAALATTQALAAVVGQGASAEQAAKQAVDLATLARTIGAEAAQRYASRLSDLNKVEEQAARAARELETTQKAFDLRQSAADADALALATLRGADAVESETLQLKLNAIVRAHRGDDLATTQALIAATVEQAEAEHRLQDVRAGQKLVSPAAQYAKAIDDINRLAADARAAGVEIDQTQVWFADRDAALQYQAALEKIHAVSGTLGDGVKDYFTDMLNGAISTATAVKDVLGEAFTGLNDNLSKLMTGQKTAWASMFRGIGESIAKMGLQRVETSIAAAIVGPGKGKDDHTDPALHQTNTLLTDVNAILHTINSSILTKESAPAPGNDAVKDAITGASTSDGKLGSLASSALSMIPGGGIFSTLFGGLFGGHRALGGNVEAGMSYDVGEMGRETFVPHSNGTIIPNNKLGDGGINYTVQVANGVTPEQMAMHVRAALQEYHPHVVRASVQAVHDHAKRGASGHS